MWQRVLEDVFELGRSRQTYQAVGRRYKLGERTVARWVAKFDHYGTSCPLKKRAKQGFSSLEPAHTEFILEILIDVPVAYPEELAQVLQQQFQVTYTPKQVHAALVAAGITRTVLE
jgi:transposase